MDRTACWLVTAWIGLGVATATLRFVHADEPTDKQIPAQEYVRFAARHKGDSARGRALFADAKRLNCTRCHRARGQGGDIGPDLSDIGGKFDRPLLIESILEPSRQIVEGYRTTTIGTTDRARGQRNCPGRVARGVGAHRRRRQAARCAHRPRSRIESSLTRRSCPQDWPRPFLPRNSPI